jgi:poly-gamma-glutamate synthesis protein (capsule biosynthesis protein)
MPRALRYFLFFFLGIGLGFIYLLMTQTPLERVNLGNNALWIEKAIVPAQHDSTSKMRILFGGDLMFDRNVRILAEQIGYDNLVTSELKQLFFDHDLVIANLEGPITDNNSLSVGTGPGDLHNTRFTFDPVVTQWLADHNFQLVNLGNNHLLDFGVEGVETTYQYLDQASVSYFGWIGPAPAVELFNKISTTLVLNDLNIGLVNYNQFGQQTIESVLSEISTLKDQVDYLIVFTHWGIEYAPEANAVITKQGRQFIESGAHLVIGTHPHVIQPYEDYLHGRIYYSLGNFIFDQYFSTEVKRGQLVQLELELIDQEATPSASFREFEVLMEPNQAVQLSTESAEPNI